MSTDATGTIKIKLEDYWKGVAQENEYLRAQLAEKDKLLQEAKQVIEFYGDESNWDETYHEFPDGGQDGDVGDRIDLDDVEFEQDSEGDYVKACAGKRARDFLKKLEGM